MVFYVVQAQPSFSLKDQLFNPGKVSLLASQLAAVHPDFHTDDFQQAVVSAFPKLELKARIHHIAETLGQFLPDDYLTALSIITSALPAELDPEKTDNDFGDFIYAPLSHFVALYGCQEEVLEVSLEAIKDITKRFSAESAIRYFINTFPDETMDFLMRCAQDSNYHVRRLASEGTRPKLPWAQGLSLDYRRALPLLDVLFADQTRYVTRSVANHLNDLSKLDPDLVIRTLARWQGSQEQDAEEMTFIGNHALRTLVKQGHQGALGYLGFTTAPDVTIIELSTSTPLVKVGEAFVFTLNLHSHQAQTLVIDYRLHFANPNTKTSYKVFKLRNLELAAEETIRIKKRHPLRLMTTRQLYAGEHRISFQINGLDYGELSFVLEV